MYLIRGDWPYYRFSWPYLGIDRSMGHCDVEAFLDAKPRPVIIVRDAPSNRSTSLPHTFEEICTGLSKAFFEAWELDPQHVHWFLGQDLDGEIEWYEVTLQFQHGAYANPDWEPIEEPQIVRPVAEQVPYWRKTRQILTPQDFDPENFSFAPGECHKVATGHCSLSLDAIPDLNYGEEAGYPYCRGLAVYAHAWILARDYFGDDFPEECPEDVAWYESLIQRWNWPYGAVLEPRDAWFGISIFAATNRHRLSGSRHEDGLVMLNDGRHRACVASRLGIPVAAVVADETTPRE